MIRIDTIFVIAILSTQDGKNMFDGRCVEMCSAHEKGYLMVKDNSMYHVVSQTGEIVFSSENKKEATDKLITLRDEFDKDNDLVWSHHPSN